MQQARFHGSLVGSYMLWYSLFTAFTIFAAPETIPGRDRNIVLASAIHLIKRAGGHRFMECHRAIRPSGRRTLNSPSTVLVKQCKAGSNKIE